MGQVFTSVNHYLVYNACLFFYIYYSCMRVNACMCTFIGPCVCVRVFYIMHVFCSWRYTFKRTWTVNNSHNIIGFAWKYSWCHTLQQYNQQTNKTHSHVYFTWYNNVYKRLNRRRFFLLLLSLHKCTQTKQIHM